MLRDWAAGHPCALPRAPTCPLPSDICSRAPHRSHRLCGWRAASPPKRAPAPPLRLRFLSSSVLRATTDGRRPGCKRSPYRGGAEDSKGTVAKGQLPPRHQRPPCPWHPLSSGIEATVTITADREHSPGTHQTPAWAWAAVGGAGWGFVFNPSFAFTVFSVFYVPLIYSSLSLTYHFIFYSFSVGTRSHSSNCQAPQDGGPKASQARGQHTPSAKGPATPVHWRRATWSPSQPLAVVIVM